MDRRGPAADGTQGAIEALLVELIAALGGADARSLHRDTPLLDVGLDSLSVVSILGQLEAAYTVRFDTDEIAAVVEAATIAGIARTVAARVVRG